MSTFSESFEFYVPWVTYNKHTPQVSITMPQMINNKFVVEPIDIFSNKLRCSAFYNLGSMIHYAQYLVAGAFKGYIVVQISNTPSPKDVDWITLDSTCINYNGTETTGSAGLTGGFSGAVSRPIKTDRVSFEGNYYWARIHLHINRGSMQSVKLIF